MSRAPSYLSQRHIERFWSRVEKSAGCWRWVGGVQRRASGATSYGVFCVGKARILAHRLAVMIDGRDLGPDQVVMHTCDNPQCVRPDHLRVASQRENLADMWAKGRGKRRRFDLGIKHHNAKLTPELVAALLAARAEGATFKALGERYGINPSTAHDICAGRTWGAEAVVRANVTGRATP